MKSINYVMAFVMTITLSVLVMSSCQKMDGSPASKQGDGGLKPAENGGDNGGGMSGQVALATIVIGDHDFSAEIAKSDAERAKGLMGRESLAKNFGMWFEFPQMGNYKFWMKDTMIPLDLLFIDSDMKVVDIIKNTSPNSTETLSSSAPFQYVLELNAGAADEDEIKIGDTVEKRIGPKN